MGGITSRRNAGVEEVDFSSSNAYRYPPKSGCYFGSHFIMGGERFETTQPEAYLFGDNSDLNFLGNRPIPFPYPAPQAHEPTKTLKSLVNIRKDSLRFVKVMDENKTEEDEEGGEGENQENSEVDDIAKYNIEFTFDSDVRAAITIYYFATEEIVGGQAVYHPKDSSMNSETYHYKRGANQTFSQSTHILEPVKFPEEEWQYNTDKEVIPVVIQCVVEDEPEFAGHSHMTFANVEKGCEGSFILKPLKQKQMVDGLCYLLQEIYGIENKSSERAKLLDEEIDDSGSECVICMSETRDTLILPCRHLCLCNLCADNLRYQANNCPICRAPFRALLRIKAMRKKIPTTGPPIVQPTSETPNTETETGIPQEDVPTGYEAVTLLEALNGPSTQTSPPSQPQMPPVPPDGLHRPETPIDKAGSDKNKTRRQSSRKNRCRHPQPVMVEEMSEPPVEPKENKQTESAPVEGTETAKNKSPKKKHSPKSKRSPEQKDTAIDIPAETPSDETRALPRVDSLEIVNETSQRSSNDDNESRDTVESNLPESAADGQNESEEASPIDESARKTPQAHTVVLYDEKTLDTKSDTEEGEPLCLPSQEFEVTILDSELIGSPINDGSGSSYSSTSSAKGLLVVAEKTGKFDDEEDDKSSV